MNEKELREIDAWLYERIYGQKPPTEIGFRYKDGTESWGNSPEYTVQKYENYKAKGIADCLLERPNTDDFQPATDAVAAMEVLKRCCEYNIVKIQSETVRGSTTWEIKTGEMDDWISAPTLELGICLLARSIFAPESEGKRG